MSTSSDKSPLSRPVRVDDLTASADGDTSATPPERSAIAKFLDLKALDALGFTYRLRSGAGGRVRLSGRLQAQLTQTCVVTLEPVEARLDVPIEAEFWPQHLISTLEKSSEDLSGSFDWPEPIIDGTIDLGPLIYETLATSLDPYPKREGASFQWSQGGEENEAGRGAFAALEALKRR